MAHQSGKPHGGRVKGAGEDITDPTRAGRPAGPTYKYPLNRGLPALDAKKDGFPITGYGKGQYAGPSSVSVKDSATMNDFSIAPKDDDAVLRSLQDSGFGDRSERGAPVDDLQRKIDTSGGVPIHPHMKGAAPGPKVPDKTGASVEQPVRRPK
jgi:hypothetical protein